VRAVLVTTALLSAPGCNQILGIGNLHLGDVAVDAPGQTCYGQTGGLFRYCPDAVPTEPLTLSGQIDTGTDSRCDVIPQAGGPDLCVLAGGTVGVADTTVAGMRALVIVAADTLTVDGTLDLSSEGGPGGRVGAAASTCRANNGTSNQNGAGGGGGGSFTISGGTGSSEGGGGGGGTANTVAPAPTVIRGGCAGGNGGDGNQITGAVGANSGGAVYLIGGAKISITGAVFASGAGADGGMPPKAGGGGGGSGGLIGLDAPAIDVGAGTLAANGGGGGEGGSQNNSGDHGDDGTTTSYDQRANGGTGNAGTNGGHGGALPDATGESAMTGNQTGGGGGGGAAGVIWVIGTLTGTKISPVAQLHHEP
jgi:hypothetical protein